MEDLLDADPLEIECFFNDHLDFTYIPSYFINDNNNKLDSLNLSNIELNIVDSFKTSSSLNNYFNSIEIIGKYHNCHFKMKRNSEEKNEKQPLDKNDIIIKENVMSERVIIDLHAKKNCWR